MWNIWWIIQNSSIFLMKCQERDRYISIWLIIISAERDKYCKVPVSSILCETCPQSWISQVRRMLSSFCPSASQQSLALLVLVKMHFQLHCLTYFPSLVSEAEYSAACKERLTLGENMFVLVRKQRDTAWNFRAGVVTYRGFVHWNCQCSQTNPPNAWPSWTIADVLIYIERIIVFYKVLDTMNSNRILKPQLMHLSKLLNSA